MSVSYSARVGLPLCYTASNMKLQSVVMVIVTGYSFSSTAAQTPPRPPEPPGAPDFAEPQEPGIPRNPEEKIQQRQKSTRATDVRAVSDASGSFQFVARGKVSLRPSGGSGAGLPREETLELNVIKSSTGNKVIAVEPFYDNPSTTTAADGTFELRGQSVPNAREAGSFWTLTLRGKLNATSVEIRFVESRYVNRSNKIDSNKVVLLSLLKPVTLTLTPIKKASKS